MSLSSASLASLATGSGSASSTTTTSVEEQKNIAFYCAAKTKLLSLERHYKERMQPLNDEISEYRGRLKTFMKDGGHTCVPIELLEDSADPNSETIQMYLRLKTSTSIKSVTEEVLQKAVADMSTIRLTNAYQTLEEKQNSRSRGRRSAGGSQSEPITLEDVWSQAIEDYLREVHTSSSTSLTLDTSKERKKRRREDSDDSAVDVSAPDLPVRLPTDLATACQEMYNRQQELSGIKEEYKQAKQVEEKTIEDRKDLLVEYLRRTDPETMSKRVAIKTSESSASASASQSLQHLQPQTQAPQPQRKTAILRCVEDSCEGVIGITLLRPTVKTCLSTVFRNVNPDRTGFERSVTPDFKRQILQNLLQSYETLKQSRKHTTDKVELEYQE